MYCTVYTVEKIYASFTVIVQRYLCHFKVAVSRDFWHFLFHESNPSGPPDKQVKTFFFREDS